MRILGLSFDYHDAAAALVIDGEVVAAAHEERFTRKKNDAAFPQNAARFCLQHAGLDIGQIDWVVHYERPLLKFDRIVWTALKTLPRGRKFLGEVTLDWLRDGKFDVRERIGGHLGAAQDKIAFAQHHASHAAAAFFCSPFEQAAIVTLDGVGEYETASISLGSGTEIRKLSTVEYPHSLGLFYSAFTAYLGFEVNEGEYKVMGMAGFGEPKFADEMLEIFKLEREGRFRLRQRLFDFLWPQQMPFTSALTDWLGPARNPDADFALADASGETTARNRHYADVAASVQKCTEQVMMHMVERAMAATAQRNVCMAGGVALNSVANGRIQRELGCELYVHPAAGDAGSAIGAALHQYHCVLGSPRKQPLTNIYLGSESNDAQIEAALRAAYVEPAKIYASDGELVEDVARRLAQGAVVGWFQGRAEWGPRALGARSILANPTRTDMQAIVNEKIKFREPFRPFAPSVLKERAEEFFVLRANSSLCSPEHFMLSVCDVRPDRRSQIPAVTHVDGTARVHLVERTVNPLYYGLIEAFGTLTGTPLLLNTSFNLRGEPIVNEPAHAIRTFQWSGMDCLVMGRHLIEKADLL